jgi:hypothetical protein
MTMEKLFYQIRCTNQKILGAPTTKIEAMVLGKPESVICIANHFVLPNDWEIGFDTKDTSHVLYAYPKAHVFKLKLNYDTEAPYPLLEAIELVEKPNL